MAAFKGVILSDATYQLCRYVAERKDPKRTDIENADTGFLTKSMERKALDSD